MRLLPKDPELSWTPYAWLIYLTIFASYPFLKRNASALDWSIVAGGIVLFLPLYFAGFWAPPRQKLWCVAAIASIGAVLMPLNPGASVFFVYAASFLGYTGSTRFAVRGLAVLSIFIVMEGYALGLHPRSWLTALVLSGLIGGVNIHDAQRREVNRKLAFAQEQIEHLAKVAERERIARDLHDVLGHTLSLVILKSELATKLAERDPERAREEIRDVERIAREALAEVRAAVTGYRAGGLQSEIQHARSTLATAGVAFECDVHSRMAIPPSHEAVLCLALRESITNIVRHAGARQARMSLRIAETSCSMTIHDDGRGGSAPFGTGLMGMHERVEALGGSLVRDGRNGTTLTVSLPLLVHAARERTA
jgi:two-component system sensor histidine kinase DesK